MSICKVCIIYPADPMGVIPGGIDTFIRGILRWPPEDIDISLVGVTTDPVSRPVGKWTSCDLGRRQYDFFPVAKLDNPESRGKIPLSVIFTAGLLRYRPKIDANVLEFHRLEPMLVFLFDSRPKTAFVHQNMQVLNNPDSDILWSKFPSLYFKIESFLIRKLQSIYSVREDAVEMYKKNHPDIRDRFAFVPTWMDPDIFYPLGKDETQNLRLALCDKWDIAGSSEILVTVGRLDSQKDPILLAQSFRLLLEKRPEAKLVFIGDGVLREDLIAYLNQYGIADNAILTGLLSAAGISNILRASDLFVLSSAYEGMPMCVLEALGTGLPVVTTNVGEVKRVVLHNKNGEVVENRTASAISEAVDRALNRLEEYSGLPCTDAVKQYTPECVLAPVYENYRKLAG